MAKKSGLEGKKVTKLGHITKAPHKKGMHRSREASPLTTSPKCRRVFWPHFAKQGPTAVPR